MRFLIICLVCVSSSACVNDTTEIPPGIMPPDSLTAFIKDLEVIEAALLIMRRDAQNTEAYKDALYKHLFEKHNTSPEKMKKTLAFYTENLALYDRIYADVITELNQDLLKLSEKSEKTNDL